MLVTLYKHDPKGRTWYYTLDDRDQSLFHYYTLTVSWGTDLFAGARRQYTFETLAEKDKKIRDILTKKTRRYKILYSYFRKTQGTNAEGASDLLVSRLGHS